MGQPHYQVAWRVCPATEAAQPNRPLPQNGFNRQNTFGQKLTKALRALGTQEPDLPPTLTFPMNLFRMAGDLTHLLSFLVLLLKLYSCNSAAGAWHGRRPSFNVDPLAASPFTPPVDAAAATRPSLAQASHSRRRRCS